MYTLSFLLAMASPVCIFGVGLLWRLKPPAYLSKGLAYHTTLTAKSPEAWTFAHQHCARLWLRIGLILGVLTAILMTALREHYSKFVLWLIVGQMVILCASVFLVDMLLKNVFDEDGKPLS